MKLLVLITVFLLPATAVAQIHRCTMADGSSVYTDAPCPKSSAESKTIMKAPSQVRPNADVPQRKIEFTGVPSVDFIKASALMDNIRVIGRDCEWALKVDKRRLSACSDFIAKLREGGEYQKISEHVGEMMKDRVAATASIDEIRRINRHMEEIVRYKEFAVANLTSGRNWR